MDALLDPSACTRLVLTLGHFLWQGVLAATVAGLGVLIMRRAPATARYGIWCAALLVMAVCPLVTFMLVGQPAGTPMNAGPHTPVQLHAASPSHTGTVSPGGANATAPDATAPVTTPPDAAAPATAPAGLSGPATAPARPVPPARAPSSTAPSQATQSARADLRQYAPYVVIAYLLGVITMLTRIAVSLHGGGRLRRKSRPVSDGKVLSALARGAQALRLSATPAIACCERVVVPTVIGVLRPIVLLPLSFGSGLTPRQVEMLLIHELVHIRRYDHLVNLAQRLIEAALFFHPAVWYVSRRIRIEREHCCDDAVLALGTAPSEYAASLLHIAERGYQSARAVSLGANGGPSPLGHRVLRLLEGPGDTPVRLARGWVVAAVLLLLGTVGAASLLDGRSASQLETARGPREIAMRPEHPVDDRESQADADLQEQGEALLREMAEVNRYWLVAPPEAVRRYSYDFGRPGEKPRHFTVSDPMRVDTATRCGVTYNTAMRALARDPARAVITEIQEQDGAIRIGFRFEEMVRGDCGNGLAGKWYGYFNLGVTEGTLWLDVERKVPLELICDILTERFKEYVEVDAGHYVPLNITVAKERPGKDGVHYDWKFRLYEPGLWLFDISYYTLGKAAEPTVAARTTNVRVNASAAETASATPAPAAVLAETAEAREERAATALGHEHMATVIEANRAWLLPPLEARRGLAYDYRQEGLYRERVLFDDQGRIMVQLEGTKDGPEVPSRQYLYLPDGTVADGNHGDAFLRESPPPQDKTASGEDLLHRHRRVNSLATGLGWDCALTRMARAPSDFLAEMKPGEGTTDTYILVLKSRNRDTKIFTGTMLTFTSWAYMHDVRYTRSEIVCDAMTHRPMREKDYDGDGKLVASYTFSDYREDPSGAAPGRIQAVVPHDKDGKDDSLEMDATFGFARPGVWLMNRTRSHFRGGSGESTGEVTVLPDDPAHFQPIDDMIARLQTTKSLLGRIDAAATGPVIVPYQVGTPLAVWAKADWGSVDEEAAIAVREARIEQPADGGLRVTLELVSTAYWKEYAVALNVRLRDAAGMTLAAQSATAHIRAEGTPAGAQAVVDFPELPEGGAIRDLAVAGTVQYLTAQYHGHGMWMSFTKPSGNAVSDAPAEREADSEPARPISVRSGEPDQGVELSHTDDTAEGKKSLGASGHAVRFDCPEGRRFVEAVQIFAGRYGTPQPPDDNFHLYVMNEQFQVLADVPFAYGLIARGDMRWYTLETPSIEVPPVFHIGLAFNPHQTKGIYLGYDEGVSTSHSFRGLPDSGYEPLDTAFDWMVRVRLAAEPSGKQGVHRLADWSPPVHVDPFEGCFEAGYDDGVSDGMQSYGGRGPAIHIDLADFLPKLRTTIKTENMVLRGIRIYGSRYGSGYNPETSTIRTTVLDVNGQVLATEHVLYALFSYKAKWVDLAFDTPIALPAPDAERTKLTIAFDPEAHRTKGIYFHYNQDPATSHSSAGTVSAGFTGLPDREWMIRACFSDRALDK